MPETPNNHFFDWLLQFDDSKSLHEKWLLQKKDPLTDGG